MDNEMSTSCPGTSTGTITFSPSRSETSWSSTEENLLEKSSQEFYFGVYLPKHTLHNEEPLLFTDRSEALKVMRKYKEARLKVFSTEEEAIRFVENGPTLVVEMESSHLLITEKSPFKAPKPQDFVRFRKLIEVGNLTFVANMVNENPRYLVSSGDTPSILQEGSRYNAAHISAKFGHASICKFIFDQVSSVEFIKKLYGDANDSLNDVEERCEVLLDLYLNTPDKALNETPLHFASKMGAVEVVTLLISYPQCDKNRLNKFGSAPFDIICTRGNHSNGKLKDDIAALLGEQYYVPVLRTEDSSIQAVVGEPFPCSSPPEPRTPTRIESKLEIKALAGPMKLDSALAFRRKWRKTPPRKDFSGKSILARPTLYDPEKGLECIGRELALEEKIRWTEYWSFLDSFTNLKTEEGLSLLENHLQNRYREGFPKSAHVPSSQSRENTQNEFSKHFLNKNEIKKNNIENIEETPLSPMTELCSELGKLSISFLSSQCNQIDTPQKMNEALQNSNLDKLCDIYAKKLVDALLRGPKRIENIKGAIKYINSCLSNFKDDQRFKSVPLNKAHFRVSRMCAKRIMQQDKKETVLKYINDISGSKLETDYEGSSVIFSTCILSNLKRILEDYSDDNFGNTTPTWEFENHCDCLDIYFQKNRKNVLSSIRRNIFDIIADVKENTFETPDLDGGSVKELDSSDSESDTFFTPPSSPGLGYLSSDDEMYAPDEGPDVFILGMKPTKTDAAVLDAISTVFLNVDKYPFIALWKHSCLQFSKHSGKETWQSPSLKELYKRRRDFDSVKITPSWHRYDFVYSKQE